MPKNLYNITHWKKAAEVLTAMPQTTARELKYILGTTAVIAQKIKTDFINIQKQTVSRRIVEYRESRNFYKRLSKQKKS